MKVITTKKGNKIYLVNSKGKRLTRKIDATLFNYEQYEKYTEVLYWIGDGIIRELYDNEIEQKIELGKVSGIRQLSEDAFEISYEFKLKSIVYKGAVIREGIYNIRKFPCVKFFVLKDSKGEYFVNEKFEKISAYFSKITFFEKEKLFVIKNEYGYLIVDYNLNVICEKIQYDDVLPLSRNYFKAIENGHAGVMSKTGKLIIPPVYYDIVLRNNNYFELNYNGKVGLADANGYVIFECIYDEIIETPGKFVVREIPKKEIFKEKKKDN